MNEKKKKYSIRQENSHIKLILFIVLGAAIIIGSPIVNSQLSKMVFRIGNMTVNGGPIVGSITTLFILLCIKMVKIDYIIGGRIALGFLAVQTITTLAPILTARLLDPLQSLISLVGGTIICLMYKNSLMQIDKYSSVLRQSSCSDYLTGHLNRAGFKEAVEQRIEERKSFYIVSIDLNDFRQVNDSLGHLVGDKILCEISDRIASMITPRERLARNSGDEFSVLLSRKTDEEVETFMQAVVETLSKGLIANNYTYYPSCTLGAAGYPFAGSGYEELTRASSIALHIAKTKEGCQYLIFDQKMKDFSNRNAEIRTKIKTALEKGLFTIVYQPVFSAKDRRLTGFESLLRMKDENGNIYNPEEFIPIAERSGQILEIDNYVLSHSTKDFADILSAPDNELLLSVNVSSKHLSQPDFLTDLGTAFSRFESIKKFINIEITEHSFLGSPEDVTDTMEKVRNGGLKITIDDFGTGYASLSSISKLSFDQLKIDRSLIAKLCDSNDYIRFIDAIIGIGHAFGCQVVAEGVETEQQLDVLRKLGIDQVQGFIWGKPLEFPDVKALLKENGISF